MKRTVCLLTTAAVTAVLGFSAVSASAAGGANYYNNNAYASSYRNGMHQFDLAFDVNDSHASQVNAWNNASATSSNCGHCAATAIAFQIVVTHSVPLALKVNNQAKAVSYKCVNCATLASAYEFVLEQSTPGGLPEGTRHSLQGIKNQLSQLRNSGLSGDDLQTAIDQLAGQVRSVLESSYQPPVQPLSKPPVAAATPLRALATPLTTLTTLATLAPPVTDSVVEYAQSDVE